MKTKDYGILLSERVYQRTEDFEKKITAVAFSCSCIKGIIKGNEITFHIGTGKVHGKTTKGKVIDAVIDFEDGDTLLFKIKYMVQNPTV